MGKAYYCALASNAELNQCCNLLTNSLEQFRFIHLVDDMAVRHTFLTMEIDIVLLYLNGCFASIKLLKFFKSVKPSIPIIIIADYGCESIAVQLFRHGAWDYFKKPFNIDDLSESIKTVLDIKEKNIEREFSEEVNGLDRAIAYINSNFSTHLTLSQVAKEARMCMSQFERAFKLKMQTTFIPHVNNLRINRAIDLLENKTLSMNDIALASGFSNQYHFSRTFKKVTKKTPTAFRKSIIE